MGPKPTRKFDKTLSPLRGFKADPAELKRVHVEAEERREKKAAKAVRKRLEAQGFEFDKFVKHVGRFSK